MRYKWYRNWRKRHNVAEVWDATNPPKSDEENVQKERTQQAGVSAVRLRGQGHDEAA